MNLSKLDGWFEPDEQKIHIIGCGSVGSAVAENLVRSGVKKLTLWDFDIVAPHNIVNQMFREQDIGKLKVDALENILKEINSEVEITRKCEGWNGQSLSGYIFLCCDGIELRKEIAETQSLSPYVMAMFDFRTGLTGAQHYAAVWSDSESVKRFLKSMDFTHDEASKTVPVSACGITLGVVTTVRLIAALGVNNYINFIKGNPVKSTVVIDGFDMELTAF